jgi:hypothetical protein
MSEETEREPEGEREIIIDSVKPTRAELDAARALIRRSASMTVRGDGFDLGETAKPGTSIQPYTPEEQNIRIKSITTRDIPNPSEVEERDIEATIGGIIYALGTRMLSPYAKTTTQKAILGAGAGLAAGYITGRLKEGGRRNGGKNLQRNRNKPTRRDDYAADR